MKCPHRLRLALCAALVAGACGSSAAPAPGTVSHEEVAADVIELFARESKAVTVVAQDKDAPLTAAAFSLDRQQKLATDATHQVLRARAESAFEVHLPALPAGCWLHAQTFVYNALFPDPARADPPSRLDPAPVTFRILVNGVERRTLSSDYVTRPEGRKNPYDVLTRSLDVPLDSDAGHDVVLRFETTRAGRRVPPDVVLAEPIWWDLQVLKPVAVPQQAASSRAPNILLLVVDTLAAGHTSLIGAARDTTPHLRELATRGLVFSRALSTSSWTLPSTASLLTGLPPNTHGVLGNERSYLMSGLRTVAEALREKGLQTAAFSANPLLAPATGFDQGFTHFEQGRAADEDSDKETAAQMNARLLAWLDGQPVGARWFAWVQYMDPHAPYAAPGDARLKYSAGYVERRDFTHLLPNQLQTGSVPPLAPDERTHVADLYDAEVAYFDDQLGALLDELRRRRLLDSTLIIVTADHGEELFDHGQLGHGSTLYDELLHVPLVLAGPLVPKGVRCDVAVSSSGLAAALMDFVGATAPGVQPSLLPPPAALAGPVFSTVRTDMFGPRHVLISAEDAAGRKLILVRDASEAVIDVLRFDLRADPKELHPLQPADLPADALAAFDALQKDAADWAARTASACPPGPQPYSEAIGKALQAIGYVGKKKPP